MSAPRAGLLRGEGGRSLPAVLVALAVGLLLIAPLVSGGSTSLLGTRAADQALLRHYSLDAGIEYGIWKRRTTPGRTGRPAEPLPFPVMTWTTCPRRIRAWVRMKSPVRRSASSAVSPCRSSVATGVASRSGSGAPKAGKAAPFRRRLSGSSRT